jgi:hypothetical protein
MAARVEVHGRGEGEVSRLRKLEGEKGSGHVSLSPFSPLFSTHFV